jgi:nickel-dependent lactate racemase
VETRTVNLPYGEKYLKAEIPEKYLKAVLVPKNAKPIDNPMLKLEKALETPINAESLESLARDSRNPCIIVSDSTRPTPSGPITEAALNTLNHAGIEDDDIKVLVATGLHRPCTENELEEMLGPDILSRVMVVNHFAKESDLTYIGDTSFGTPVWINSIIHDSDLLIGDGYIEPHFFAGYTGGGKNILPGVAGAESIMHNHGANMIGHPKSRAGVLDGNPIYMDILEASIMVGFDFSINVTMTPKREITGIFAGDFKDAHRKGAEFIDKQVKLETEPSDIVITTNSGYPLDRDLYQTVKAMATAEPVTRENGVIIVASECRDGVGHPEFMKLVVEHESPSEILETIYTPGFSEVDQWEAQILARVLTKCHVILVSDGVDHSTVSSMHMDHASSISNALEKAMKMISRDPEISIIPYGPSIIATTGG